MENPLHWKIIERDGKKMHEGIHAIVQRAGTFLLVQRRFYPFGYSFVAGHVDRGEDPEVALLREVREEISATASNVRFLFTLEQENGCPMVLFKHFNYVYSCDIDREPKINFESKSYGWFTKDQLKKLNLTKFTKNILRHLGVN